MVSSDLEKAFEKLVPNCVRNGVKCTGHYLIPNGGLSYLECANCKASVSHLTLLEEVRKLKASMAQTPQPQRHWDGRHKFSAGKFSPGQFCEYCLVKLGDAASHVQCAQNSSPALYGIPSRNYERAVKDGILLDPKAFKKQVDCTCPTLLNGHHHGCPMRR